MLLLYSKIYFFATINFIHFLDGCTNSNVIKLIKKKWKTSGTIFKLTNLRDDWNSELIHTIRENLASLIPYELSAIYKIYCFGNEDTEQRYLVIWNHFRMIIR